MWTSENRFHTFRCKYSKLLVHFQIKKRKISNYGMHFPLMTDAVYHGEISWTCQAAARSLIACHRSDARKPSAPRAPLSRDDSGEVLNRDDGWEMLSRDDWRVFVMSTAVERSALPLGLSKTSRSSDATYPSPARMAGIDATYPWLDWSFLSNTDRVIVRTQYIYSCAYNTYRLLTISMYSFNPLPGCVGLSSRARSTSGRLLPQGRKKPRNLVRPPPNIFSVNPAPIKLLRDYYELHYSYA